MSEYLGAIPFDITVPWVPPWMGAMTAASLGASWLMPQNGLMTDWAMTSWS